MTLPSDALAKRMDSVELDPAQRPTVDLVARTVTSRAGVMAAGIPYYAA